MNKIYLSTVKDILNDLNCVDGFADNVCQFIESTNIVVEDVCTNKVEFISSISSIRIKKKFTIGEPYIIAEHCTGFWKYSTIYYTNRRGWEIEYEPR